MSRLHTLQDEVLNYSNDYDSIIIVKDVETTRNNRDNLSEIFSLQFYSPKLPQKQTIKESIPKQFSLFKIKTTQTPTPKLFKSKPLSKPPCAKTPAAKQSAFSPLLIKPSFLKIQQLVSKQKTQQLIDFKKFKKSIY